MGLSNWFPNMARYTYAFMNMFFLPYSHTLKMTKPDNCTELWKITMLLCRLYPNYTKKLILAKVEQVSA